MRIESDLCRFLLQQQETVRDALNHINDSSYLFQLITDTEGRLVGTVTDGDIRRAIITGYALEDPIHLCMHKEPIVARTVEAAMKCINSVQSSRRFVPVLDAKGHPVQLVIDSPGREPECAGTVLIMAGGFGRRMGAHTRDMPKPLLQIAGRPLLERLIQSLEKSGFRRIFIATHYLHDKVQHFTENLEFQGDIELIEEHSPLGTAGALGCLPKDISGPLMIINGDILTRTDFGSLLAYHEYSENLVTIGATRYEFEVPFGVLEYAGDGRVSDILEKPRNSYFVAAGIYVASPELCTLVHRDERIDMPDLLRKAIRNSHRVGMYPIHEYWIDVGRPADIRTAENEAGAWRDS